MSTTSNTYDTPATRSKDQQSAQSPSTGTAVEMGGTTGPQVQDSHEGDSNPATEEPTNAIGSQHRAADISTDDPALKDPGNIQSRLNAREPPAPYPEGYSSSVGQNETRGGSETQKGGVGDLGTHSDVDVARLPEERRNPDPLAAKPGAARDDFSAGGPHQFAAQNLGADAYKRDAQPDTLADSGDVQMGPPKDWTAGESQDRAPHSDSTDQQGGTDDFGSDSSQRRTAQDTFADNNAPDEHHQPHSERVGRQGHKDGPSKLDKLKGNLLIAKGKVTKGQDEIKQGQRLKETGTYVDADQVMSEDK